MRPDLLFPLFVPIASLKGIGPRLAPLYRKLVGELTVDLLWHLPHSLIDRSYAPKLGDAERGRVVTLQVKTIRHNQPSTRARPYQIIVSDGTADLTISYFNAKGDYLKTLYPVGEEILISGTLERYRDGWSMNHPDFVLKPREASQIPRFEPVYPLTSGITNKLLRRAINQALERLPPNLPEWNDPHLLQREAWPNWESAIRAAHNPSPDLDPHPKSNGALRRLAYDELLADQLGLAVIRRHHRAAQGRALKGDGSLIQKLTRSLPFKLTPAQNMASAEIGGDMAAPRRMLRLLQGDVGSGKTIVALFAMLQAMEAGAQSAMMAPTEILARQHHARLRQFLEPLGIEVGLLTGKSKGAQRTETLQRLASKQLSLVVGTHALFQDEVVFQDLGLAVVDEQHRFGVNERLRLSSKGRGVDILVMTATPIPRTLTLTAYGDMDVSRLMEKPAGRHPIDTRVIDMARLEEVIEGVGRKLAEGAQAYWVCPLIEESELVDLAAASDRAERLKARLKGMGVGLIHGKMKSDEKDQVMQAFKQGLIKLLVATTVIEVGVDVPNASLMVIEHAERFGLAQLHQLRGRVGRGSEKSDCLLLYQAPLGQTAAARLKMLRETGDGFRIAEEDLRLRGPGELLGRRQSGLQEFRLADLAKHSDLLEMASADAKLILSQDPELKSQRGQALRILLYLFARDEAVPLLRAG